jgi:ATP-dependent RNA helicase RhlE
MAIDIAVASGEAPADRGRPVRANNRAGGRGGQAPGQGRGGAGQGRPEGRPARPARRPHREGEAGEARAHNGERQERRPQRESNRNADFRGQRRDERTPRPEVDNDLTSTSDFRPAKKPQHNGHANANGAAHEAGAHRGPRHAHGRPTGRHDDRGQNAQGEQRKDGGMKRRGPGNGGQRRERA